MPPTYPRTHPVTGPVSVSVRLFAGNVHVSGADVAEAEVDLQPTDSRAEKIIERSRVDLSERSVRIDVPKPGSSLFTGRTPGVSVRVTVPHGSTVDVAAGSADVVIEQELDDVSVEAGSGDVFVDNCGRTRVKTGSGDVRLHGLSKANATTGSGDISVSTCAGDLDVNTASGDIEIDRISADARAQTASGDVVVDDVESSANVRTSSGEIIVRRASEGSVGVTTVSGGITVGVTPGTAAMLDCTSVTGRLTSELDGIESPATEDRTLAITARSVSGGIHIVRAGDR